MYALKHRTFLRQLLFFVYLVVHNRIMYLLNCHNVALFLVLQATLFLSAKGVACKTSLVPELSTVLHFFKLQKLNIISCLDRASFAQTTSRCGLLSST